MDAGSIYVCTAYVVVCAACIAGAFSRDYSANLLQRLALAIFALWSTWRAQLVYEYGWGYPHETLVATALLLYAAGSALKTLRWKRKHTHALKRFGHPARRKDD